MKLLNRLSQKTRKYVLQNALKCVQQKIGNVNLSLQIINFFELNIYKYLILFFSNFKLIRPQPVLDLSVLPSF